MSSIKSILLNALDINHTVIEDIKEVYDENGHMRIDLYVRPRSRHKNRCPICHKRCSTYDHKREEFSRW